MTVAIDRAVVELLGDLGVARCGCVAGILVEAQGSVLAKLSSSGRGQVIATAQATGLANAFTKVAQDISNDVLLTARIPAKLAGQSANLSVTADSRAWLGFVRKERSLLWALLLRKIRLKGSPRLLVAFGKCFPS